MSMFDKDKTQQTEVTAEQAFEQLVGEGKKYATAAEAAKALLHSQVHIGTLESELAELRTTAGKAQTVEEIIAELKKTQVPPQQQAPAQDPSKATAETPDVSKLVEEALGKHLSAQKAENNKADVTQHFMNKFGTKAGEMFEALGKKLGMDLEEMSATNPAAVKALADTVFGSNQSQGGSSFHLNGGRQPGSYQGADTAEPTTRRGIEAAVKALNLTPAQERREKFKRLHDGLNRAILEGRVDEFNR